MNSFEEFGYVFKIIIFFPEKAPDWSRTFPAKKQNSHMTNVGHGVFFSVWCFELLDFMQKRPGALQFDLERRYLESQSRRGETLTNDRSFNESLSDGATSYF